MEELIIQQNQRQGRLSEFVKSTGETLTLGRGLNNDIILSDHFIASEQVRFDYEQGHWVIKVLDDTNPVLLNDKPINTVGSRFKSGDQLTLGRTHLVLLLSNHPIERTRKLMLSNWMYHKGLRITLPVIMVLISALLAVFTDYQETASKIKWGQMAGGGLAYIFFLSFWAGCWALIGRLLRHKLNFFAQLFYTSLVMALLNTGMLFSGYVEYITANNIIGYLIEGGFWLILLSVLLKYNLTYATEIKKRGWISFSVIAVLMFFTFSMSYLQKQDFHTYPDYSKTLKPPFAKWFPDKSIEIYIQDLGLQFDELEKVEKITSTKKK